MRSAFGGPDAVDERLIVGSVFSLSDRNVPSIVRRFVDDWVTAIGLCVFDQVLTLQGLSIPDDLGVFSYRHRKVPDASFNETQHIGCNLFHSEAFKVGFPFDCDRRLALAWLHGGFVDSSHVHRIALLIG